MMNLKQNEATNCVLYSICNLLQEDMIQEWEKRYPTNNGGHSSDYMRYIIENETTNGWTITTNYATDKDCQKRMQYDDILFGEYLCDENEWFLGFAGVTMGKDHMISFAVSTIDGAVIVFDSLKSECIHFKNGSEVLEEYDIIGLYYLTTTDFLRSGIPSFFCEWLKGEKIKQKE